MFEKVKEMIVLHKGKISLIGVGGVSSLLVNGAVAAGNYTPQYSPTDISSAGAGITYAFGFFVDTLTAISTWMVTNALGQLCLGALVFSIAFGAVLRLIGRGKRRK